MENSVIKFIRTHRLSEEEIEGGKDNKPDSDDEKEPKKKVNNINKKRF